MNHSMDHLNSLMYHGHSRIFHRGKNFKIEFVLDHLFEHVITFDQYILI